MTTTSAFEGLREAYGDPVYRRLAEVEAKYDPDNVFHHNTNIPPVATHAGPPGPADPPKSDCQGEPK